MKLLSNSSAEVYKKEIIEKIEYKKTMILEVNISYPQINLQSNLMAQNHINIYYQNIANSFYKYALSELKASAIDTFAFRTENKYPIIPFDATMNYTITLNEGFTLSDYIDQYQYAGGAHGSTVRTSSSWNLNSGALIEMKDLFPPNVHYIPLVVAQIEQLAKQQIQNDEFIYFDDYQKLIPKYFNPKSFYLTPTDLVVYYQQYDIGPYASGIIEFQLPYKSLGISPFIN